MPYSRLPPFYIAVSIPLSILGNNELVMRLMEIGSSYTLPYLSMCTEQQKKKKNNIVKHLIQGVVLIII